MKRILLIVSLFLFFFVPTHVFADDGWQINNFQSSIAIEQSGKVRVVETIVADFQTSKHGIFRDIPITYESDNQKTYTDLTIDSVQRDGHNEKFEQSNNGNYIELKIGDPNKTLTGQQTYSIQYSAKGVLRSFPDHDELYWNATGNQWEVPILQTEAQVTLPKDGLIKTTCYQGYSGSTVPCKTETLNATTAKFTATDELGDAKGLTVVVGYQKGMVPILTVERPKSFWEKFIEWPSLSTLIVALFFGLGTVFYLWNKNGRDYWFGQNIFGKSTDKGRVKPIGGHETITVEFTPPEKLRPAEIGVLIDERADTTDVVATIIDLATRGYLTITEIPKKWLFGSIDYKLTKKNKTQNDLLRYEQVLYDDLFSSGNEVTVSSLKKTFYNQLATVKKELYKEVVAKKLFDKDPESIRGNYLSIGFVMFIFGIILVFHTISAGWLIISDILLGISVTGFAFILASQYMPRRTTYGRELYRRIKGYRLFINSAEKYRQQFFEKKNMFNEVLPYAIMFGITGKFAQQMKDMGVEPSTTGWYVSSHPFTATAFASNMNGFSTSMSSAIASTPSSSGGFSGGSSGGGFGGGGGGSW